MMHTGDYDFEGIGIVHVLVKPNARYVRARWKGGKMHVTVPPSISSSELHSILKDFAPKLEAKRPESPYCIGQTLQMPDFSVDIVQQSHLPDKILMNFKHPKGLIQVGSNWDIDSAECISTISKMLCKIARYVAPSILITHAKEVAARVSKHPKEWTISSGHRILGHCSSKGVIALSYALVFYPKHLREYVICHELAHLTEMNHSERFHIICNSYCNGREKELTSELKKYKLPIIR